MSNLIIKWLIGTDILTDCSLHSTVQYLTKHGNWLNAGSHTLHSHIVPIPPGLSAGHIPLFNPLQMYGFCCSIWCPRSICVPMLSALAQQRPERTFGVWCVWIKGPVSTADPTFLGAEAGEQGGEWGLCSTHPFVSNSTRIKWVLPEKGNPSLFLQAVKGQYPGYWQNPIEHPRADAGGTRHHSLFGAQIFPLSSFPSRSPCCTFVFLCCSSLFSSFSRSLLNSSSNSKFSVPTPCLDWGSDHWFLLSCVFLSKDL